MCPVDVPDSPKPPLAPMRAVIDAGRVKDGDIEQLECGHALYNVKGKPRKRRRCPRCLEEGRT